MINFDNIENSLRHEIADDNGDVSCDLTNTALLELITRLRQAEKDAARYRWIVEQFWFQDEASWRLNIKESELSVEFSDCVEEAIDEAMQCK